MIFNIVLKKTRNKIKKVSGLFFYVNSTFFINNYKEKEVMKSIIEKLLETSHTETETELKGLSFGLSVEDIANKHGVDVKQIEDQLEIGLKIEQEHVKNNSDKSFRDKIARQISMDHLEEFPDYYTQLEKMENEMKSNKGNK